VLCGQSESVDHIFFVCDLAAFAWSGIREAFGVQWNPRTFQEFFAIVNSLAPGFKQAIWLLFAAQSWALWNIRNKITIEHKLLSHPADCIFKTSLFLQLWRPLLRSKLADKLDTSCWNCCDLSTCSPGLLRRLICRYLPSCITATLLYLRLASAALCVFAPAWVGVVMV
jgi:hypothetical protein